MKNIVYRNYDRYAIKHLLVDIGEHRINLECRNKHLNFPKRLGLFFIESNDYCTTLKYNYPLRGNCGVMVIDGYDLPESGWVRVVLK
ncbi:hypothetical protein K8352_04145 [Flavobacteriaceae bacterium F89]|uniref:Uncharacterized protein n=1 Tax=Cerina litoralis TaxID=2874477 RepID=A0AAE3ET06_9FLAO|nr:hypothetical protein [Cerina litoralis]MCG2459925.1 hypothetical protein [Cerina litoralis]